MLLGASGASRGEPWTQRLARVARAVAPDVAPRTAGDERAAVVVLPWRVAALDAEERLAADPASGSWLAVSGHLYGDDAAAPIAPPAPGLASRLLARLTAAGPDAVAEFDGSFAIAFHDGRARRLHLIRDRFGIEPLFYAELPGAVAFASRTRDLAAAELLGGGLCPQGLAEFLTYCYAPGDATLDRGVRRVPAGSRVTLDPERGVVERRRWYRLSFAGPMLRDEAEIASAFRDALERAVVRRLSPLRTGAFLSGGMDSSSVVTFTRRHLEGAIETYGFRCAGQGFDESVYARAMAEAMGTRHTEVEFGETEALTIEDAAREMDVPFCDVGINVGTWILGRAAEGRVDYLLTGDGGDEWWASHPVYAAERLVRVYEKLPVPRFLHRAWLRLAARIPDTDQKRDLGVKLKRILPRDELPRALGPFRWRAYAIPAELQALLTPELAKAVREVDPFRSVLAAYDGYDGPDDGLTPHLYNDYVTASSFYFSRLHLLRRFGLEARSPFYDRALVELGARVPASLKLEGVERTKRLFRVAMEGVLPDVINHRKDKLGHSVPMKLWLRGPGRVADRVAELLSPAALEARGLFRPEPVQRLLDEHRARRHNHSHRIWALYVLELWLRARDEARG